MKRTILSIALAAAMSSSVMAGDNKWEEGSKDAWIDGKAEATLLFNTNLDSFDINTDVEKGVVTLTGKVENEMEKELAEELVMGIDGVTSVENSLTVMMPKTDMENEEETSALTDMKIATVVKSRLLFDSEVSGTDINVDVEKGVVTLEGKVDSDTERDLAITIAQNAEDVMDVRDELEIESDAE